MTRVQNIETFKKNELRKNALKIIESAYEAIDTEHAIERVVQIKKGILYFDTIAIPLSSIDRIFVVGAGKCSPAAACALDRVLGTSIHGGLVIGTKKREVCSLSVREGTHPFPSIKNISATKEMLEMLQGVTGRDLVIALISGGGSTLLCNPTNMTCENEKDIVQKMFVSGATIEELNTVRKHISGARGGMLAYHAYPARVISLIFSDVPGNDIGMVASGPTVMDTTTVEDAKKIIEKYKLESMVPEGSLSETTKDEKYFTKVTNKIIVSNDLALKAMKETGESLGFNVEIVNEALVGEAKELGKKIALCIASAKKNTIYLFGGEPTVIVTHEGKGGRQLEFALSSLAYMKEDMLIAGFASDGRDNCDFAGAICDIMTSKEAETKKIDPIRALEENASYAFFSEIKDAIVTGETGANVSDLMFAIKK